QRRGRHRQRRGDRGGDRPGRHRVRAAGPGRLGLHDRVAVPGLAVTLVPEGTPGARTVTVTALEMLDPGWLRPSPEPAEPLELHRSVPSDPVLSRECYLAVGGPWSWVDRLGWSPQQWQDWVDQPGHELWTLHTDGGAVAGYFELVPDATGDVLLAYF